MSRKLIAPPGAEPVLLADAKLHLRVTDVAEDSLVSLMIATAREECENAIKRALITQIWEGYFDGFPDIITLFYPPLQTVNSIKYVDATGATQTLANTEYLVDANQEPARITPAFGKKWPVTRAQLNAVTVNFTCGYGADGTKVPEAIRNWMLVRATTLWDNRDSIMVGTRLVAIDLGPQFVDGLLDRYRVAVLG